MKNGNRKRFRTRSKGFTLIEAIVSLVLVSVMAAAMFSFLQSYALKIEVPRRSLNDTFALRSAMENMVAHFQSQRDMDVIAAAVGAESTSQDNAYGAYTVVHNRYIDFNASNQEIVANPTNRLLKITIRNDRSESLTRLFGVR